jgi:CRISPR/Cas system-associated exonuclease Cas4 (RecB family)
MTEPLKYLLIERFHRAITKEAEEAEEFHRGKLTVTSLCYPCLRRAYYAVTYPDVIIDPRGAIRTWIGRKLHETSILGGSMELKLEYNGIVGIIDEYSDSILIDKKTTRNIPRVPYEHHVRQLEYYRLLCEKNHLPVKSMAVIYIDVDSAEIAVYPVESSRSLSEIEEELMKKRDSILEALKTGILPPRNMATWEPTSNRIICQFCPWYGICLREEWDDPRWKDQETSAHGGP